MYGAAVGMGSDRLSLNRFDSSTGYYLYDPRGSVTGIIDEEGQVYQSYRYSAFGEITFGAPEYENEYTYNGESYNSNIKSQYLRARYYSVVTASFLTADSYLGNIMGPLTLNRYNYCVGNLGNYADPSGNTHAEILEMHADWLIWCEGIVVPWEPGESYQEYRKKVARQANMDYKLGVFNGVMEPIVDVVKYPYALGEGFLSLFSDEFNNYEIALDRIDRRKEIYLERCKDLAVYKTDYYGGKCVGNGIAFGVDVYLTLHGLAKSGEAMSGTGGSAQNPNPVRVTGGYDTLTLANATALAEAIEGSLGAAARIWLSQSAWDNLQDNFGKIDMDRVLGNEDEVKAPDTIRFDSKQLGKKWGKHKTDYPNMNNYMDYQKYANEVFDNPDKIIFDEANNEYLYIKENDLLRLGDKGDFISLYPGSQSGIVMDAITNGGTIWP